jgi:hypothetical protein
MYGTYAIGYLHNNLLFLVIALGFVLTNSVNQPSCCQNKEIWISSLRLTKVKLMS